MAPSSTTTTAYVGTSYGVTPNSSVPSEAQEQQRSGPSAASNRPPTAKLVEMSALMRSRARLSATALSIVRTFETTSVGSSSRNTAVTALTSDSGWDRETVKKTLKCSGNLLESGRA